MQSFEVSEHTRISTTTKSLWALLVGLAIVAATTAVTLYRVDKLEASQTEMYIEKKERLDEYNRTLIQINDRLARIETKIDNN